MARLGFLFFFVMSAFFAWFHGEIAYALDVTGISGKAPNVPTERFTAVARDEWQLLEVNSFEKFQDEGLPQHAWDGDPETFWHTEWKTRSPKHPHHLAIDMGRPCMVYAIKYLPRQTGFNGRIKEYAIQLSEDGEIWREVAGGTFASGAEAQLVRLPRPTSGRFLRIDCLSELGGNSWASIAELNVLTIE